MFGIVGCSHATGANLRSKLWPDVLAFDVPGTLTPLDSHESRLSFVPTCGVASTGAVPRRRAFATPKPPVTAAAGGATTSTSAAVTSIAPFVRILRTRIALTPRGLRALAGLVRVVLVRRVDVNPAAV